jgi:hypothetical protein
LRRNWQITATSARSSIEYKRRWPWRAGTTTPRSSHHCVFQDIHDLPRRDARQFHYLTRCKLLVQSRPKNVSNKIKLGCLKHFRLRAAGVKQTFCGEKVY